MALGWTAGVPSLLWGSGSTTAAPEFDLYMTHNSIFRSRLITGINYLDTESQWSSGYFEYSVDFGLKSFFRRYVYRDPNVEKNKLISMRVGYAYIPSFQPDSSADETRGVAELTLRLPMGGKWLWTDRNKGDFRDVDGHSSERYRNRLRLERGMAIMGFRGTPYASGEAFYDTQVDRWNRFEIRAGFEIPWQYSVVFDPYFAHQAVWQGAPQEIIGFVVQKHMAFPIGGSQ
jgi:hypothetical protein